MGGEFAVVDDGLQLLTMVSMTFRSAKLGVPQVVDSHGQIVGQIEQRIGIVCRCEVEIRANDQIGGCLHE
jgi:hypothetical protein